MIFTSVQMRLVLWCQKVQFLKGFVVLGLTPSELMQCLIPPPEILKGWGETTVGFWGHSYDNLGIGEGLVSGVSMYCGAGMSRLKIISICFFKFCVSSPN